MDVGGLALSFVRRSRRSGDLRNVNIRSFLVLKNRLSLIKEIFDFMLNYFSTFIFCSILMVNGRKQAWFL